MMTAGDKECELPTADSCAIMEGEDAEDDLIYLSKKSFFTKIKSFSREVRRSQHRLQFGRTINSIAIFSMDAIHVFNVTVILALTGRYRHFLDKLLIFYRERQMALILFL